MTISFCVVCQIGMIPLAYAKAMTPSKSIKLLVFSRLTSAARWFLSGRSPEAFQELEATRVLAAT
jgi:hypothetical protein